LEKDALTFIVVL